MRNPDWTEAIILSEEREYYSMKLVLCYNYDSWQFLLAASGVNMMALVHPIWKNLIVSPHCTKSLSFAWLDTFP